MNIKHPYSVAKVRTFMGMDCPGFNADLMLGKRKVAEVIDSGDGGMMRIHWTAREDEQAFDTYIATLPEEIWDGKTKTIEIHMAHDMLISELIDRDANAKRLKRMLSSKVIIVHNGKVYAVKAAPTPATVAAVCAKHQGAIALNALPFDEALDTFLANAA